MFLTRESLLRPADRRIAAVDLPDGRRAYIRSLNELEHSRYESAVWRKTKRGAWEMDAELLEAQRRRLVALCVCDPQGIPLLTEDDVEALGQADGALIKALAIACRKHCGLDEVEPAEGGEKNSPATAD